MELTHRPGANLLRLLAKQRRELGEFALAVGMATDPQHALANVRRYTHAKAPRWPQADMILRWAAELGVDPVEFYRPVKKELDR